MVFSAIFNVKKATFCNKKKRKQLTFFALIFDVYTNVSFVGFLVIETCIAALNILSNLETVSARLSSLFLEVCVLMTITPSLLTRQLGSARSLLLTTSEIDDLLIQAGAE